MKESGNQVTENCPECGAPRVDGMDCWEQMAAILGWESQDFELAAEHFLTVASYNLQHPAQFNDEAMEGLKKSFIDYLDHGVSAQALRRRANKAYNGKKRVLKQKSERHPVLRHWSMTIADVYLSGQPEGAARRVRGWAAAIRNDLVSMP